jgi:Fibronectin type III domain/Right handed beta helix region
MRIIRMSAAVAALALAIAATQAHFEPPGSSPKSARVNFNVYAATTIRVPTDYKTIQAAISAAANGDTIVVSPGTYAEQINFLGKAITVQSAQGPSGTIIDGGSTGTVVTFNTSEGPGSVLQGFTIQHGFNQFFGGGIYVASASPTIKGNVITNNVAGSGGAGIDLNNASPVIQGNSITNNSQIAGYSGGGGGGIELGGAAQIVGNTISGNTFSFGGGLSVNNATTPTIENNIIQNNVALYQGGGMWLVNGSDATIVQNLVTGNTAPTGAGMYLSTPSGTRGPWLTNNTLASNFASGSGSAIYATGFFNQTEYFNNILVGASGQAAFVCDLSYTNVQPLFDHNDIFSGSSAAVSGCAAVLGANGNISVDPLFVGASDFSLQAGSPSINSGNNAAPNLPSTDLAGNPRVIGGVVDQGAYEFLSRTVPGPVQNLTAAWITGNSARVSWTAPAYNGGTPITSYTVTVSPSGAVTTVGPTTTSLTFTKLKQSATNTFTVFASNAVGNGPPSSVTLK